MIFLRSWAKVAGIPGTEILRFPKNVENPLGFLMFPPAKRKRVPAKSEAARGYPVAKVNAASYAARGILQNYWKTICFRVPP